MFAFISTLFMFYLIFAPVIAWAIEKSAKVKYEMY